MYDMSYICLCRLYIRSDCFHLYYMFLNLLWHVFFIVVLYFYFVMNLTRSELSNRFEFFYVWTYEIGTFKKVNPLEKFLGLPLLKTIRGSGRIVFVGCGTSYYAALAARPILEELCDEWFKHIFRGCGRVFCLKTHYFFSRGAPAHPGLHLGPPLQSSETADTLNALEYALENGALCVGITNTIGSSIARNTHYGPYTSQIVVMAMVALAIGAADSIITKQRREGIIESLLSLPGMVQNSKCLCDIK
ncbi:putative sugar isomerase (SIS) [Helianthus annuus]|nr:putative sugar isomerase (SIS) [Helianthus annuus]